MEDESVIPDHPAESLALLPEDPALASQSAVPTADETPVRTAEDSVEGLHSTELAAAEPILAAEEHASGLEGATVEADPAAEESIPADEQMVQETAALSSSEASANITQEAPSVEAIAASEPEAILEALASSENTGVANAGKISSSVFWHVTSAKVLVTDEPEPGREHESDAT
jgi:hypothetical protein